MLNAKDIEEGKNRGEKLIIASYLGKDVGVYLTTAERESGMIELGEENLKTNNPYVIATNIRYKNGFKNFLQAKNDNINKYLDKDGKLTNKKQINKLHKSFQNNSFALYQEQYTMTEQDPQIQFMMILSDKDDKSKVNNSSLKYLGKNSYE